MENEELFNKKIRDAKIITIWGHVMPDPDCYGCQIGLRDILRLNFPDKKVYAIGSGIPVLFDRLKGMDNDVSDEEIASSLGILVDVSCIRRVEDQRVCKVKDLLKFDNHMFNEARNSHTHPSLTQNAFPRLRSSPNGRNVIPLLLIRILPRPYISAS